MLPMLALILTQLFIARWVGLNLAAQQAPGQRWILGALALAFVLLSVFATFLLYCLALSTSNRMQLKMLDSVTKARVLFFDANPLGRIINRFSKDT